MLSDADLLNASILIVDDQLAHVQMLERLLQDSGYTNVSWTLDPQQVCSLHRANRYDLILLDLLMPVLDGFGVMDGLKAHANEVCLPVIVFTAQPAHKLRALQAGARDFINKPFDIVEVKIRIRHMLEVRLLYRMLEAHNKDLEKIVQLRTAELQESEARFRNLMALAADWYWELNDAGEFTQVSGPIPEILGIAAPVSADARGVVDTDVCRLRSKFQNAMTQTGARHHARSPDSQCPPLRRQRPPRRDRRPRRQGRHDRGHRQALPAKRARPSMRTAWR
jgi:CheY-like chemotaxis protein